MGYLKKFFRNVFEDGESSPAVNSFTAVSEEELEAHLAVKRYGPFLLTDAIRPSIDLKIVPQESYRHDIYHDPESKSDIPVLMASPSAERLFDVFMDLLEPLGPVVDVVLETSHESAARQHVDLYREHIDMPVLKSTLWEFEDLLCHDGCTGIAVLNPNVPQEVQFDEHKLLITYGTELSAFEDVFQRRSIPRSDEMRFLTEAEHVHSTTDRFVDEFNELRTRLGMDGVQ